jgi:crotonobetainyl-CoA:carnitine CoA-transferase CaiB-like acyl-CoA transferase
LARKADVIIENFRPGTLEKWNCGWAQLAQINPRLILARVSGYGQTGPYSQRAGYGGIGEAMGGLRYIVGEPDRPPSRVGISIGDSLAGVHACMGTLAALHHRERTGVGQVVDAAIYESVLNMMESLVTEYDQLGHVRERSGPILPRIAPSNVYPTRDGIVMIGANQDTVFTRLVSAMNAPELSDDPRYRDHQARGAHQQELDEVIARWTATHETRDLLALLERHGVPSGLIYRASDMLEDPHFAAREAIVSTTHPQLGNLRMQNVAPRLSVSPGSIRTPAPEIGQHNAEIYEGLLGLDATAMADFRARGVI